MFRQGERSGPLRIKWWRLKEKEAAVTSRILLPTVTTVDEAWQNATDVILSTFSWSHSHGRQDEFEPMAYLLRGGLDSRVCSSKHSIFSCIILYSPVQKITVDEVEAARMKMKPGKATGPDDLAPDL
ncbi:unnamed protein product [Heligmosomoides polygyrus]|uniref:Uncharacterized protein n=1 Tax=Heligmosomoides polygyrus TaxID=6339 RepID=A0A183GJV3_HELPZ|nr:unnamed protein product [Heligmosomoides polygyrus]